MRKKANTRILLLLSAFLLLLPLAQSGRAQTRGQLEAALRRLDHDLALIEKLAGVSVSPKLQERIALVRKLRNETLDDARAGREHAAAEKLARAQAILEQLRRDIVQGPVLSYVQRYAELLRQAERGAAELGDKELERLVNEARKRGTRAGQLAKQGDFQAAAEAYRSAIFLLETVNKRARRSTELRNRLKSAEERYFALFERLREQPPSPFARKLLEQAQRHAAQAQQAANKANWKLALDHYNSSLRLLYRVLEAKGPNVERELRELDRLIDQRTSVGVPAAEGGVLQRVSQLRQDAWRDYRRGRLLQAARKVEIARRLLDQATHGKQRSTAEDLRRELGNLRRLFDNLAQQEGQSPDRDLFRAIQALMTSAEWDLRDGRLRPAGRKILISYRLLGVIQARPHHGGDTDPQALRQKLERLQQELERAKQGNPDDPLWQVAGDLIEKAENALRGGNLRAAQRFLRAVSNLLSLETGGAK